MVSTRSQMMKKYSNIMKYLLLISLFCALQLNAEEVTKQSILGTWYEKNETGSEITTFIPDGTWSARVIYFDLMSNTKRTDLVNGTWKLIDNTLVKTVTWATKTNIAGAVITYKITSFTVNEIKFTENGRSGIMKRLKGK